MVGSDMPSRSTMSGRVNLRLKEIIKLPQKVSTTNASEGLPMTKLLVKQTVLQQKERNSDEDHGLQALKSHYQNFKLRQLLSKRKREDPEESHATGADKHMEKRHRKCPGPLAAGSRRPLKPPRGAKRMPKENAHASMLQEQRAFTSEEDAVAPDLARARACLHVALGMQQDALKKQKESHAKLCDIRAKRDNVAVHVLLFAREAASAAAILRRRGSAGSTNDLRRAAREREAAAAAHLAECQMEQELAEAEERIRHLAAQLKEEAQWRTEAEAVFWEYGLVAPELERHSETLRLQTPPHSPPEQPAPGTPPLFENTAAVPRLPMQQLLSRLSCMHK